MLQKLLSKTKSNLIWGIIILAFLVRIWGIDFGLPAQHIIDEQEVVYSSFLLAKNGLRPLRYHAPLAPFILFSEYGAYYIFGNIVGVYSSPESFFTSYLKDPTTIFLISRLTLVLFGIATVWLVFLVGKELFNKNVGILASFFLSINFLHAKESHYIKQDVLATFFVMLAFYFSLKIVKSEKIKYFILTGAALGLAISAKASSILILPSIFLAIFPALKRLQFKKVIFFALTTLVTLSLVNPYLLKEPIQSFEKLKVENSFAKTSNPVQLEGKPVSWWYATVHLPEGMGWVIYLSSIFGFAILIFNSKKDKTYLLLPAFPLIFLSTIDFWTTYHSARYALPTVPFFVISASFFIFFASKILRKRCKTEFLVILVIVAAYQPLIRTIKFDYVLTVHDTRDIATKWVEANIPEGSKVLVESTIRPEYTSNLNLTLYLSENAIDRRIKDSKDLGLETTYLSLLKEANKDKTGYDIIATPRRDIGYNILTSASTPLSDANYFVDRDAKYAILTSWAITPELRATILERFDEGSIGKYYSLIKKFEPKPYFDWDPHFLRVDYHALDSVDFFDNTQVFGPIIEIYQLK